MDQTATLPWVAHRWSAASLSGTALLPRGRGRGTVTPGGKPVYEGNANIFITGQTSHLQTSGRQHRQAFAASFSPAPIQQKRASKCNSSSGADFNKTCRSSNTRWGDMGWGRTDNNSLEVFSLASLGLKQCFSPSQTTSDWDQFFPGFA